MRFSSLLVDECGSFAHSVDCGKYTLLFMDGHLVRPAGTNESDIDPVYTSLCYLGVSRCSV